MLEQFNVHGSAQAVHTAYPSDVEQAIKNGPSRLRSR
jgi:hypothetical protein